MSSSLSPELLVLLLLPPLLPVLLLLPPLPPVAEGPLEIDADWLRLLQR